MQIKHSKMLIDSHIHIQDVDLEQFERFKANLVNNYFMNCSTSLINYQKIDQGLHNSNIVNYLAFHPWHLDELSEDAWEKLELLLEKEKLGVGECGLDKAVRNIDFKFQKEVFVNHLDLAHKYSRPIVIHCVKAYGTLLDILRKHAIDKQLCMIHAYNGSTELLDEFIDLGLYISLNFKSLSLNKCLFCNFIKVIPRNRLLLESDFPYMLKDNYFRNMQCFYDDCATLLDLETDKLEDMIKKNFIEFNKNIIGD